MFCKNCGSKLNSDTTLCPNCYAKVDVSNDFNSATVNMVTVNDNITSTTSKPATTFIFVTTLIIMILLSFRMAYMFISYESYYNYIVIDYNVPNYQEIIRNALNIAVTFAFLSLVFSITVFILIANIKKAIKRDTPYKNMVKTLLILAIINIALYLIYALAMFNFYSAVPSFPPIIYLDLHLFPFLIAFAIVILVKSLKLRSILNRKEIVNSVNINNNTSTTKTTFFFVSTLIIMLIFCLKVFFVISRYDGFFRTVSYQDSSDKFEMQIIFFITIIFTILALIFSIIIFVVNAYIENKIGNNRQYKSNTLVKIAIISLVIYLLYALSAIYLNMTARAPDFYSTAELLTSLMIIAVTIVNQKKSSKFKKT